jgi:NTP pyrophosphatase (non-canonical NTP hydrolase)
MKYEELELNVIKWAKDKEIFDKSDPLKQLSKTQEELDETLEALKLLQQIDVDRENNQELIPSDHDQREVEALFEAKDGIGDMLVTIIILAEMLGFTSVECLEAAYNVIKNRKGKMIDGLFVKEKV